MILRVGSLRHAWILAQLNHRRCFVIHTQITACDHSDHPELSETLGTEFLSSNNYHYWANCWAVRSVARPRHTFADLLGDPDYPGANTSADRFYMLDITSSCLNCQPFGKIHLLPVKMFLSSLPGLPVVNISIYSNHSSPITILLYYFFIHFRRLVIVLKIFQ